MTIPETIEMSILDAYDRLTQTLGTPPAVAVRSSAIGEDTAYSFTGQFLTLLNVRKDNLIEAYRKVVESLFSTEAVHYRQLHKLARAPCRSASWSWPTRSPAGSCTLADPYPSRGPGSSGPRG